ncbi:hypothetical protein G9A89_021697 [Geosiphon pyriformis]|nr:hypothetical protein G9A89_021697 [Geosiphon pyriformis]
MKNYDSTLEVDYHWKDGPYVHSVLYRGYVHPGLCVRTQYLCFVDRIIPTLYGLCRTLSCPHPYQGMYSLSYLPSVAMCGTLLCPPPLSKGVPMRAYCILLPNGSPGH